MRRSCSTCDPSLLPDVQSFFEELDRRRLLVIGPDLVVATRNDSGEILGSAELPVDLEGDFMGDEIAKAARSAGAGEWQPRVGPRDKTIHLVRRRHGRTVPRPRDLDGWTNWLNASNSLDSYVGEWFLITEHGWRSLLSHSGPAGSSPRLRLLQPVNR
jgi:hypothetical protein